MNTVAPLRIRRGFSTSSEVQRAVAEVRQLIQQEDARLILFYCSASYDLPALAAALQAAFGSTPTIGCTAAGHVGLDGFTTGGITAISLAGDLTARPFLIDLADVDRTVPALAEEIRPAITAQADLHSFGLLLVDGISRMEEQLASLLYRHLPQVPIVGGSASGHLGSEPTHIYVQGAFRPHAAVFTLLQTRLPFQTIKFAHFVSTGDTLVVTESAPDQRVVYEINGEPAAAVYASLIGVPVEKLDAPTFSRHPLILEMNGEQYVRSIASANPDHSLSLYCVVENGVVLSIGRAVDPAAVAEAAFQRVRDELGEPALVLGCDCISRRLEFESSGLLETMGALMRRHEVFGFSTYGEQLDGLHMNQTFTGVALGREYAAS